jgi:hypothetical protein
VTERPREDVRRLGALVGAWTTTATHPAVDATVTGSATFEWLAGGHFLIGRSHQDHDAFPDGIVILGADGRGLSMRYFDSRGVERSYGTSLDDGVWRLWRDGDDFSQRFEGRIESDTITGLWHLSNDGGRTWVPDLAITYRREQRPAS